MNNTLLERVELSPAKETELAQPQQQQVEAPGEIEIGLTDALEILGQLPEELKKDQAVDFIVSDRTLAAFALLKAHDTASWIKAKNLLKKSGLVSMSDINTGIREIKDQQGGKDEAKGSQATLLVELAEGDYFHDERNEPYATLENGGHMETWPVRSKEFKLILISRFYTKYQSAPGTNGIEDALKVLEGRAIFEGPMLPVAMRIGGDKNAIYLDLADKDWRAVEITREGWRVVDQPWVKFRRSKGMQPIPAPVRGGCLADIMDFINLDRDDWLLLAGWLVQAAWPTGPYPVLGLQGEQGSAKSTFTKIVRNLIDPAKPEIRSAPRDERDLHIAARNSWIVAYDNLSSMPVWLSDSLCRISTGGGLATRELHSDFEESLFDASRPIILNGIEAVATRSDLLDRSIMLELPTISETTRRTDREISEEFEVKRPEILGALLDAMVTALTRVDSIKLEKSPRMADFAVLAVAAEPSFRTSKDKRTFLEVYTERREDGNAIALENSVFGNAVIEWMDALKGAPQAGSASELLKELNDHMNRIVTSESKDKKSFEPSRIPGWPSSPARFSGALKRLAPNLRNQFIRYEVKRDPTTRVNKIHLTMMDKPAPKSLPPNDIER